MSEHKSLWEALLAFKAEAPTLPKDKINPHFKSRYTPLDTIAERIDPLLTKHGLVWTALPGHGEHGPTLDYKLVFAPTGETLAGSMPLLLDKTNSQGLGSALTYSRRYAKTAVLDLVADEDDDGNGASASRQRERANGASQQPTAEPLPDEAITILSKAIADAKMGTEWVRGQLVAVGAESVPDGPVMKSTLRALTPEQARAVIEECDKAAEARMAKA